MSERIGRVPNVRLSVRGPKKTGRSPGRSPSTASDSKRRTRQSLNSCPCHDGAPIASAPEENHPPHYRRVCSHTLAYFQLT
jgi:hypothetical protein